MILLVHPSVREWAKPCNLPLGLAYLAASLKKAGVEYGVFDDNMLRWSDKRILEFLKKNEFSLVGISAICHQYKQVKRWVGLLRQVRPDQKIVIGGAISVLGHRLAQWLNAGVWVGEAEVSFPEVAKSGSGLSWGTGATVEDLDALSFPSWDDFNVIEYANAPVGVVNKRKWADGKAEEYVPRSMNVLAARGCPFRCAFCAHDFMGKRYRVRSPGNILAEIMELYVRFRVEYIHLSDDNTTAKLSWLYELCKAFREHLVPRGITWGCASRADTAGEGVLRAMYDSGCRIVGMGIESGSQRVLDAMNKRIPAAENERAVLAAKKVFGAANYSMIVGTPGETDADIQASIDFCKRTETRPEVVFYATPLPGAEWYGYALEKGLIADEEKYLESLGENSRKINCNISGRSDAWLEGAKKRIEEATKQFGGAI